MEKVKNLIKKYYPHIILVFLVIPSILPLFHEGFFSMHDDQQVARLYELDRALAAGQFPARWVGNLGFGYGYPLYIFYPPLIYYLGEIFHLLLGLSFIVSIKLVFAFSFIGAALSMYIWAKEHFGKIPAIVAAAFYTYVPYHAVDAYVRGALAELTSFVWLPLILWSADRLIIKRQYKYWLWLGAFLALLLITHNLIFLPFFPIFILYIGLLVLKEKNYLFTIRYTLYAILLSLGLASFFWIPTLAEKQYTLVDSILLSDLAEYRLHFVYPSQLWNSLWGYGGSTAGLLDGLSFKIGKLHVVLSLLAPLLWVVISRFRKAKNIKILFIYSFIYLALFTFSAFMTTNYSQTLWAVITPLQYLQFPWRFLTFTALFSAILAGSAIAAIFTIIKSRKIKIAIFFLAIILLFLPNLKLFKPQTYLDVNDSYYTSDEFLKWKISKTSFEFLPRNVKTLSVWNEIEKKEITQVDISRDQIARSPYKIISGEGEVKILRSVPGSLRLNTKAQEKFFLQLNTYDFPGWQIKLDSVEIPYTSENDLKLIEIEIPSGNHLIYASFRNTQIRKIANLISIITISFIIVLMWKERSLKRDPPQ